MPSMDVRRSARVCGVVKGVDGARVLRSGRQVGYASDDEKVNKGNNRDKLSRKTKKGGIHSKNNGKSKEDELADSKELNRELSNDKNDAPDHVKCENPNDGDTKKMFVNIYSRKRKRMNLEKQEVNDHKKMFVYAYSRKRRRVKFEKQENYGGEMYGIQSSRKWRHLVDSDPSTAVAAVITNKFGNRFPHILNLVLRYTKNFGLILSQLAAFLLSEPLRSVFASNGICFMKDLPTNKASRTGSCRFFESRLVVPSFSLDFLSVPCCFKYLHLKLAFRFKYLIPLPVNNAQSLEKSNPLVRNDEEDFTISVMVGTTNYLPEAEMTAEKIELQLPSRASKLGSRNTQYRSSVTRGILKKRRSLRTRRGKIEGGSILNSIRSRKTCIPSSFVAPKNKFQSSARRSPSTNFEEESSPTIGVKGNKKPSSCNANILVIESDRCYRIEGATVDLEISNSREWMLVASKEGSKRCTYFPRNLIGSCCRNQITRDIIWTGDKNWKLEFCNQQDWLIFSNLYKECLEKNVNSAISRVIPVPGVNEVSDYDSCCSSFFSRPEAYITVRDDEVARALAKSTANYDLDCEDEEWLEKFNRELVAETDQHQHLSADNFELMIDAFEKASFCSMEECSGEADSNLCSKFGNSKVVESVRSYWNKKRKQKRAALLRVFQNRPAKKTPSTSKPKRKSSKRGRPKKSSSTSQVMTAEEYALEERNAMVKIEEARESLKRLTETAIRKRQTAQLLMENAELATYKAAMALKIAETLANPSDVAEAQLFD